jgi:hypothetical protein
MGNAFRRRVFILFRDLLRQRYCRGAAPTPTPFWYRAVTRARAPLSPAAVSFVVKLMHFSTRRLFGVPTRVGETQRKNDNI